MSEVFSSSEFAVSNLAYFLLDFLFSFMIFGLISDSAFYISPFISFMNLNLSLSLSKSFNQVFLAIFSFKSSNTNSSYSK